MRFAVMGTGGVGGYFGGRLAAAGEDVTFIARGAHLDAILANGLSITSGAGDVTIAPAQATDTPASIGAVDCVLFTVKLYDTDPAGALIGPVVGPETMVVNLQNGIDGEERLAAIIGEDHVVGGVAYISAHIEAPGKISHAGKGAKLTFGELDGTATPRIEALAAACAKAGYEFEVSDDIQGPLWSKLAMLASMSAVSCLTRLPIDVVARTPETAALLRSAMEEVVQVARAKGVNLSDDTVQRVLSFGRSMGTSIKPSMLVDLERGKPLEVDHLSGAVVRAGAAAGVATPFHSMAAALLAPLAKGRAG
jgi:2-dehydropantoate 2-reductase